MMMDNNTGTMPERAILAIVGAVLFAAGVLYLVVTSRRFELVVMAVISLVVGLQIAKWLA